MPNFDENGNDLSTFAPFILRNALDTEWADVRLEFSNWKWLHDRYGDTFDDYYLNGYGVEGLVKAIRFMNGLDPDASDVDYNSEGDACYIHLGVTRIPLLCSLPVERILFSLDSVLVEFLPVAVEVNRP